MAESPAPPLHKDSDIQCRRRSHPPVRRRDVGSLSEADQATGAVSSTLLALHPWHQWQDHVSSEEVIKTASLPSIESILLQMQLRWACHVSRMEDVRMPKAVFFSELQEEKRDRGAPRKRYKDQLKRHLAQAGISHQSWQQEASVRDSWRSSVRKTSCEFEAERHTAAKKQHTQKKKKKNAGGRKSVQHPYHPHSKPSSVQNAVGGSHQESVSTATKEHARIDHQPSQQSSSAKNEPPVM